MRKFLVALLFLGGVFQSIGQKACPITSLGQTPSTAYPICGTSVFVQGSVNLCTNNNIPVPVCNTSQAQYTDINPYYYKFTCYKTGTLGFVVTPNNLGDDYDWQLWDITNQNPQDIYTNTTLFVTCNWSGVTGLTGTSDTATGTFQCASPTTYATGGVSPFSSMPTIIIGHTYLLLVSHYTNTQSGYTLSFGGGTASITDPTIPIWLNASGICGGQQVYIKLNKKILCNTIDSNGSDFSLSPANVNITGASGYGCNSGFDTDSIIVQLNNPLTPGNYSLFQLVGNDGNTLVDNCLNAVPTGTSASFDITSQQLIKAGFTDSIHYGCRIDTVTLTLGGQNIVNWNWYYDGIALSGSPADTSIYYTQFGSHNIKLVASNSVCSDSLTQSFFLANAPLKASFTAPAVSCPNDTVHFTQSSIGNIVFWEWNFSNGQYSNLANPPVQTYPAGTELQYYPVQLAVTDSIGCSDTTIRVIEVAPNCYIAVPSAFTPNGDGLNDYLYPLNAYQAENLIFRVFNRWGQLMFQTTDWTSKWDGTYKGIAQPAGTYVWSLEYTEFYTGNRIRQKGTTVLIR